MIKGMLLMLMLLPAADAEAQEGALATRGQAVFKDQGCYGCHTVGKTGTPIATDLSRIGAKHDQAYFARWLRDPSEQRPRAHMPKLQLTESEVRALAAYLGTLR